MWKMDEGYQSRRESEMNERQNGVYKKIWRYVKRQDMY